MVWRCRRMPWLFVATRGSEFSVMKFTVLALKTVKVLWIRFRLHFVGRMQFVFLQHNLCGSRWVQRCILFPWVLVSVLFCLLCPIMYRTWRVLQTRYRTSSLARWILFFVLFGSAKSSINTVSGHCVQFVFLYRLNEWEVSWILLMRVLIKVIIVRWVHMQLLSGVSPDTDDAPAVVDCQP
jgi:hypothetical protein